MAGQYRVALEADIEAGVDFRSLASVMNVAANVLPAKSRLSAVLWHTAVGYSIACVHGLIYSTNIRKLQYTDMDSIS